MTWSKENQDDDNKSLPNKYKSCPSCGHRILCKEQAAIHELPGLPAGVKFDPTDQELLEHLEGKVKTESGKLHPLIDEFIPTLEGENGICYTHPEKLPGVTRDGLIRHFFHRPSKAYTTGTRKRRKVHSADEEGGETRWHKTGKTRPVFVGGKLKGFKKILVLYTNYGKQRKPEKTNWVMHQYHLGSNEEEKDGELVVSKVFYQTQPRQCSGSGASKLISESKVDHHHHHIRNIHAGRQDDPVGLIKEAAAGAVVVHDHFYNSSTGGLIIPYGAAAAGSGTAHMSSRASPPHLVIPNFVVHDSTTGTSFLP